MIGLLFTSQVPKQTMRSSPIVSDYSCAPPYPLLCHLRSAAVSTTSAAANSCSPRLTPTPTYVSLSIHSFSSSSSKLLVSCRRCSCLCCRFSRGSFPFDPEDGENNGIYIGGGGADEINDDDDDNDDYLVDILADGKTEELLGDGGVFIEIKKLGRNSRHVRSKIGIEASLDSVWNVLTNYEKLSDFIPALVVSELVEKEGNRARVFQIGQQNLALNFKFNAKAVLDCYEKELEILPHGKRRDIEFKMVEGDFQLFEGKWSIEQLNKGTLQDTSELKDKAFCTTLSYQVDVRPKAWLPVRLIEGRLCNEIKTNLSSIRAVAQKAVEGVLHDL